MLVLMALFIFMVTWRTTTNEHIVKAAEVFATRVQYEGYVDRRLYEDFRESAGIKNVFIDFYQRRNVGTIEDPVYTYEHFSDIMDEIYQNGVIYFEKGDDFQVYVYDKTMFSISGLSGVMLRSEYDHEIVRRGGKVHRDGLR